MNKEDIIRMAREAQMPFYWRTGEITYLDKLERFAALVASAERERIKQANAPEIERINAHIKELEDAVKEALAQTEQPKVRTGDCLLVGVCASEGHKIQPQRTWVGLTDEEIEQMGLSNYIKVVRETEAALKAKNT